jgi:predicted Zn finger-like uncharacterized protein
MFYRDRIRLMIITCPKCKTRLTLPDEKLKPEGTKFRCSKCAATLRYKGKGRRVPQEGLHEPPASPPFSPSEEIPGGKQAIFAAREEHQHEDAPLASRANSQDVPHAGEASGGTETERKQDELTKTDEVSHAAAPQSAVAYSGSGEEKRAFPVKAVIATVFGLLILVLAAVFFSHSGGKTSGGMKKAPEADKGMSTSPSTPPGNGPVTAEESNEDEAAALHREGDEAEQPASMSEGASPSAGPAVTTEEEAIELVKRSDALLKRTSVESLVKLWTEKNAANYKIVGWQAKKTDDQKYLVSYIALDGDMPKGFYFELNAQSGVVADLARHPELQKKYNIRYAK